MSWCESHQVDYVLGLARNSRLEAALGGNWNKPGNNGPRQATGFAASKTFATRRETAGAASDPWWARPSIWTREPTRALS